MLKLFLILNIASLVFSAAIDPSYKIACRDEYGNPIDWFTLYKLPRQADNTVNPFAKEGSAYAYITDSKQYWSLSSTAINRTQSFPAKTLEMFYNSAMSDTNNLGYIMYNDQFENDLASRAHAKGVIFFDNKSAFWLIHSIPEYPPKQATKQYTINDSQMRYGQSMLCLSLPLSALDQIGKQLLLAYPQVYDSFIPASMQSNPYLANIIQVAGGMRNKLAPYYNVENLKTLGGSEFVAFHKSTYFYDDLYAQLVAPQLKSGLFTETWSNGVGTQPSNCSNPYPVHNIDIIRFNDYNTQFTVNSDHSKWGLNVPTSTTQGKYVCIGDINRQLSQYKRGGGTVCFKNNANVWKSYYNIINEVEPCNLEAPINL